MKKLTIEIQAEHSSPELLFIQGLGILHDYIQQGHRNGSYNVSCPTTTFTDDMGVEVDTPYRIGVSWSTTDGDE